jgi:predicted P-loop ATPase
MERLPMLAREMPKAGVPGEVCNPRPVTDQDATALQEYLQHAGLPRVPRDTVFQAIAKRADEHKFHPVRDYLAGLRWDGTPRLATWLTYYLGAEASAYTGTIGPMFLVSMVARVMEPGCKADHLVVLEGPQGAKKSTACAIIGGQWFSDNLPDIGQGKEAAAHLNGKWLIEVGEMHAIGRAEATLLKSFITRRTERFRPAYGRAEVVQERQCMFIATTNQKDYLKDPSGGRRFWPVEVGSIDTEALAQDRDQLFAEAVVAFQAGRPWWPDADFEREHITPQQEERFASDPWEQAIIEFFKGRQQSTVTEIAHNALGFENTGKIGTGDANRIRAVLQALGMKQLPKDGRGNRNWSRP